MSLLGKMMLGGNINLGIIFKCNEYTNRERDMVLHLKGVIPILK